MSKLTTGGAVLVLALTTGLGQAQALERSDELERLEPEIAVALDAVIEGEPPDFEDPVAREEAARRLRVLVREAGPDLVTWAVRRTTDPSPAVRLRAQVILAVAGPLDPMLLEPLRTSSDPCQRSLIRLRQMKAPGGIPLPGSGTLALAARWAGTTDDPILGAAPWIVLDLLHGLEAADGGDSRFSDEFLEEWRTRLRPRLVAFWKHIPAEDRFLVELDGDPGEEWLVVARDLGATGFVHDFRFLAILDPGSGKDFGGLLAYERLDENEQIIEVGLADLDGDGTQEILVRTIVPAGWCWSGLHVIGTTASHRRHVASSAGWQAILSCDGSPPFMIATASPFQPLPGGKATYLSGVVALTCDLASWAPEGLRPLGSILLPR